MLLKTQEQVHGEFGLEIWTQFIVRNTQERIEAIFPLQENSETKFCTRNRERKIDSASCQLPFMYFLHEGKNLKKEE